VSRSFNHRCCGKATNIPQSELVFVALGIQHAMHMLHIVICGTPGSTVFFHIISQKSTIFKKKYGTEYKMCVLISSTTYG
jgi:hypothetical protein